MIPDLGILLWSQDYYPWGLHHTVRKSYADWKNELFDETPDWGLDFDYPNYKEHEAMVLIESTWIDTEFKKKGKVY